SVEDLDQILRTISGRLFPFADELMPRAATTGALPQTVATVSSFDRSNLASLGDALLQQEADTIGRRGGEYLTPASVRKLIVALADPTGVLYNPATGVGQLIVDSSTRRDSIKSTFGQEINRR